jgi:hypothetical protein
MRDHMPKVHKEFIETIAEKSNIRNYGKSIDTMLFLLNAEC